MPHGVLAYRSAIGFDVQERLLNAVVKLIFVLTIAPYWAVSTGFLSSNERTLRLLLNAALSALQIPKLWEFNVGW